MAYETLKLEKQDAVTLITFNRPEKRNAISVQMIEEILAALAEIEESETRVGILTGAGSAFCAGMDLEGLSDLASQSVEQNVEDSRRMAAFFHRLYGFPKPLIAAVNGHAIAGGCGLATLCDFTISVPSAKFGYSEARVGFLPALVSVFLVRQIGEKRARDLLLSARLISADEAFRLGLITHVVARDELLPRARKLAQTLIANSPQSLVATKHLLLACAGVELDRELELAISANAKIRATDDFHEGLASFLEKRPPKWTGK